MRVLCLPGIYGANEIPKGYRRRNFSLPVFLQGLAADSKKLPVPSMQEFVNLFFDDSMITTADSKLFVYPFTDQKLAEGNILIVDDHQENINVLEEFLAIEGYINFASTRDPRQVSDLVKSFHPDLILLDLSMPYMSGLEVLDKLKEIVPANNFLPVLVLTADVFPKSKEDALSRGAHGVVSKPFHLLEVGLRIKNMLSTRFLQQFFMQSKNPANSMLKPTIKLSQPNGQ